MLFERCIRLAMPIRTRIFIDKYNSQDMLVKVEVISESVHVTNGVIGGMMSTARLGLPYPRVSRRGR